MAPRHDLAAAMALRQHLKDAGRTIFNAEPSLINETRKIIESQHRIFFLSVSLDTNDFRSEEFQGSPKIRPTDVLKEINQYK